MRAAIALGDEPAARAALAGLRTLADMVRTPPMQAAALAGRVAANAVHRSAHGLVADEIFEVREGV